MAENVALVAQRKPDADALVDERGRRSWSELDARVNRVIHALRALGLEDGDHVAIMCGNRRELFEVTLGAMHASWVQVQVNWHWVADELRYVLADSAARALVVEGPYLAVAADALARLDETGPSDGPARPDGDADVCPVRVAIDAAGALPDGFVDYESLLAAASDQEPDGQRTGGPMFYTSGTTGFPKGVRGSLNRPGNEPSVHRTAAEVFCGRFGIPADGVTLLDGPAYHSAQWVFAVFPLLGAASTLVMRRRFDPTATLAAIDRHGVTNVHLVPTQFIRMLKLPGEVRAGFDGSSLVTVAHGAAPCPPEVKHQMLRWWGPVITEYYGGTEGGFLTVIDASEWLQRPGSIGRETSASEVVVLDDDGRPCAPGEPGQIWFRSRRGADFEYHNDPGKTAAAHREGGWGTLGDIGHIDAEGYFFLSDRRIDMIISGGVNIYPAEIEGVLVAHPAVADAAVFGVPDDDLGERVVAAIELASPAHGADEVDRLADADDAVRRPAAARTAAARTATGAGSSPAHRADDATGVVEEVLAHCREHLAGYKVPRQIEVHAALPRQPTGKLYKRLLRDPHWEGVGRSI